MNYLEAHQRRVAQISKLLATLICPALRDDVVKASLLHDIGKSVISDAIIQKQGSLDKNEWAIMRQHPIIGAELALKNGAGSEIALAIRHHHERYDGQGYPDRLKGEEIPLLSRVLAVADAFDAMTTDRSYRTAFPVEKAIEEVKVNAGFQFDPQVAMLFVSFWEVDAICCGSLF